MPGRHQSEQVADISPECPAEIVGIRTFLGDHGALLPCLPCTVCNVSVYRDRTPAGVLAAYQADELPALLRQEAGGHGTTDGLCPSVRQSGHSSLSAVAC
jgi:hypothetical protein